MKDKRDIESRAEHDEQVGHMYTAEDIERIRKYGINADHEDKSPMEDYADTIVAKRIVEEWDAKHVPVDRSALDGIKVTTADSWYEEKVKEMRDKVLTSDVYNSLEQIMADAYELNHVSIADSEAEKEVIKLISKLEKSIKIGKYIADGRN